ncbi:MAG: chloride channel protein [Nitrospiraceae bacterium]|nr:chloride channel protein [Nitrospiraceae bacterium]
MNFKISKKYPRLEHSETPFSPGLDPMVPMLLVAAAVGVIGSLAVELFRTAMYMIVNFYASQEHLVAAARSLPLWARVATPAGAGVICGLAMWAGHRWIRRPRGPEYMEAVHVGDGVLPLGPNLVRTGSSLLGVSGGITIGREGTMIQFASLASSLLGRIFHADESHRRLIVACGAAAGFAAAYRAPIAGTLFVAEIILGGLALREISAVLVAAVISLLTTQAFFASGPLYIAHAVPRIGFNDLFDVTLVGVAAGLFGPVFLWLLHTSNRRYQALFTFLPVRMGVAGLAIGLLSVVRPEVWGNGVSVMQSFLSTHWALSAVMSVFLLRLIAVTFASAAGIPGGVLTPTLVTGAALGLLIGQTMLIPSADHSQTLWILVGAGSLLAATTHAPAMSALMVFETTHNYHVVLAALPACVIASVVGSLLRHQSVYTEALGLEEHGPAASAAARRTILPKARPFHLRSSIVAVNDVEEKRAA